MNVRIYFFFGVFGLLLKKETIILNMDFDMMGARHKREQENLRGMQWKLSRLGECLLGFHSVLLRLLHSPECVQ